MVNDFALQGWALAEMTSNQYQPIFNAPKDVDLTRGKIVVIGPGTGLGTCLIMPNAISGQSIYTSEAGHSTIPYVSFENEQDQKLNEKVVDVIVSHYQNNGAKAITEHLVSGTGIVNIYHALKEGKIPADKKDRIPSEKIEKLAQEGDKTTLKTFDIFNAYLGAHAGTMVATTKTQTIFFCGGVMASPWIRSYLENTPYFTEQFIPRSGLTEAMKKVRIYASVDRDMSTLGAVVYAKQMIENQRYQEKRLQADQDMLRLLSSLQQFINHNCPAAKEPMKKVVAEVKKLQKRETGRNRE